MGRALDDLLGDWSRKGGQLTRAEVAVLATNRRLSPVQHGELLELLEESGIDLPDPAGPSPKWAAAKVYEHQSDAVAQYLRTIGRYPLIGARRETELWSLISQGAVAEVTERGGESSEIKS